MTSKKDIMENYETVCTMAFADILKMYYEVGIKITSENVTSTANDLNMSLEHLLSIVDRLGVDIPYIKAAIDDTQKDKRLASNHMDEFVLNANLYHKSCAIIGRFLSYGDFKTVSTPMFKHLEDNDIDLLPRGASVVSKVVKIFGVDQRNLSAGIKKALGRSDEKGIATVRIKKSIDKMDGPDGYDTYEKYYEYVSKKIKTISGELYDDGFFGTHDNEMFTHLAILRLLSIEPPIPVYNVLGEDSSDLSMPTEALREIGGRIFEMIKQTEEL